MRPADRLARAAFWLDAAKEELTLESLQGPDARPRITAEIEEFGRSQEWLHTLKTENNDMKPADRLARATFWLDAAIDELRLASPTAEIEELTAEIKELGRVQERLRALKSDFLARGYRRLLDIIRKMKGWA